MLFILCLNPIAWKVRATECAVMHARRGQVEQGSGDMKIADLKPIKSPDQHNTYKCLGVFENTKQVLEAAAKTYLQRLSIIWSSPLSDHAKVVASNQYALPVLTYLMWTQTWPTANIQQLDREERNIIVEKEEVEEVSSPWRMNTRTLRSEQQ